MSYDDIAQLKLLTLGDSGKLLLFRLISVMFPKLMKENFLHLLGVGKTWLLLRWAGVAGKLSTYGSAMPTIGIDFKMKTSIVKGRRVKVQVVSEASLLQLNLFLIIFLLIFLQWDTAGQERFRNITTSYYRHSQGVMLVYDITDLTTFDSIRSWMGQIKTHADAGVCTMLVGNKCDLEDHRVSKLSYCTTVYILQLYLYIFYVQHTLY